MEDMMFGDNGRQDFAEIMEDWILQRFMEDRILQRLW